jgi:hypothetical protein
MLKCDCCPKPYQCKSSRTMRHHRKKMRENDIPIPKLKPGPISKKPKFATYKVSWEAEVEEMAKEHYVAKNDGGQASPCDKKSTMLEVFCGKKLMEDELTAAIEEQTSDDFILFRRQYHFMQDPNHPLRLLRMPKLGRYI